MKNKLFLISILATLNMALLGSSTNPSTASTEGAAKEASQKPKDLDNMTVSDFFAQGAHSGLISAVVLKHKALPITFIGLGDQHLGISETVHKSQLNTLENKLLANTLFTGPLVLEIAPEHVVCDLLPGITGYLFKNAKKDMQLADLRPWKLQQQLLRSVIFFDMLPKRCAEEPGTFTPAVTLQEVSRQLLALRKHGDFTNSSLEVHKIANALQSSQFYKSASQKIASCIVDFEKLIETATATKASDITDPATWVRELAKKYMKALGELFMPMGDLVFAAAIEKEVEKKRPIIIAVLGAGHIANLAEWLISELGFEKVKAYGDGINSINAPLSTTQLTEILGYIPPASTASTASTPAATTAPAGSSSASTEVTANNGSKK